MSLRALGVDVGGTFTDLLFVDLPARIIRAAKVSSTTDDQSRGIFDGIAKLGVGFEELGEIVHGTTVATNAILERKGAICGMITTRGFRDILELGRRTRPQTYGMYGRFEALIPRELRLEVAELIDAEGNIVIPLDEQEVVSAAKRLISEGAEALVIHFLHSYKNPCHETRAAEIARRLWPNEFVSTGSGTLPEFREFERGSTAALNAYVQPVMSRYLGGLQRGLNGNGYAKDLLLTQGNGGMMAAADACREPVHTVMSGPAAGVIAAAATARQAGYANVISCDMGGTSFDVAMIKDGRPVISNEKDVDYSVPIRVPMIDVHTIGAGGGSIAFVNAAGILQVGPVSVGSTPGPISCCKGGTEPTTTDAAVLLGLIGFDRVSGAQGKISQAELAQAFEDRIGAPLGLDAIAAADAVIEVSVNQLAGAIRLVSIERGLDPRDFALFAFGGGGPLYSVRLARELGIPTVIVPRFPGLTSALGCVVADVRHDFVRTVNLPLDETDGVAIDAILSEHVRRGMAQLDRDGIAITGHSINHQADMLFEGQSHVLCVPVESPGFSGEKLRETFLVAYRDRFDIHLAEMRPVLMTLRTTITGHRPPLDFELLHSAGGVPEPASDYRRSVYLQGRFQDCSIIDRSSLRPNDVVLGPAIVEQPDTTVVIDPDAEAMVDPFGNLIVHVEGRP